MPLGLEDMKAMGSFFKDIALAIAPFYVFHMTRPTKNKEQPKSPLVLPANITYSTDTSDLTNAPSVSNRLEWTHFRTSSFWLPCIFLFAYAGFQSDDVPASPKDIALITYCGSMMTAGVVFRVLRENRR